MDIENYKTEEKGYTSYITYDKIHVIFEFWPSIELEEIEWWSYSFNSGSLVPKLVALYLDI